MRQKTFLRPHEIRVMKIGKAAILEMTLKCLSELCFEKYQIHNNRKNRKQLCVEWLFREDVCELGLYLHSSTYTLRKTSASDILECGIIDAIDSLLLNNRAPYFQSVNDPLLMSSNDVQPEERLQILDMSSGFGKERTKRRYREVPLLDHEARVIRLSKKAIQEILWEEFMEIGCEIMDLPQDDFSYLFFMNVEEKMKSLTFYAIRFSEFSDAIIKELDSYFSKYLCFTANSVSTDSETKCYFTIMTHDIF